MLAHQRKDKQQGLTLIEMMIALVLGLFVTAVIITVFSTNVRSSNENLRMIRLNQELRGAMGLMTNEFKRAGYSASSSITTFMDRTNFTTTCANYSYDVNSNSSIDTAEYYGFRFDEINNEIDWGSGLSSVGCTTGWQAITDSNIASIVTLNFTANTINIGGTDIHEVQITLVGETTLPHDNDPIKRKIIETVRIRNYDP